MSLMSPAQRAEILDELGSVNPAAPELVFAAVHAAHGSRAYRFSELKTAEENTRRVLDAVPSIVRRLLDVESDHAALRATVARLIVANHHGEDFNIGDLASELERVGIDLKHEYAVAEDLARAQTREGLL